MTTDALIRIADGPDNRLEIRIPAGPAINCGRVRVHPSGRGLAIYPDWPSTDSIIQRDDGSGLSISEAREAIERLDNELSRSKR